MKSESTPSLSNVILWFKQHFFNRTDRIAVNVPGRRPCPAEVPDLDAAIRAHVGGESEPAAEATLLLGAGRKNIKQHFGLGAYAPAPDGTTKWLCLDFDGGTGHASPLAAPEQEALKSVHAAERLGLTPYLERSASGCGFHVWIFFENGVQAKDARTLGFALVPKDARFADGTPVEPTAGQGIEVFPKQDVLSRGGTGTPMRLPWWHGATGDGCLFVRPDADGVLAPYLPTALIATRAEAMKDLIKSLGISERKTSRRTPAERRGSGTHASDWLATALSKLPLEEVYGDWLTGKKGATGWLECRDPWSESGDRTPSAGVADDVAGVERGFFHSFATRKKMNVLEFLVETGRATDMKAACLLVASLAGVEVPKDDLLPRVQINKRQYRDVIDDALRALRLSNVPPVVFERFSSLVRLTRRHEHAQVELIDRAWLLERLGRVANWFTATQDGWTPTKPPADLANAILSSEGTGLPRLEAVATTPTFAADGTLLTETGYHAAHALYLDLPSRWAMAPIPEVPSKADVDRARTLILDEVFFDFPWVNEADKAHAFAALLLPFMRRFITGATPLHLFEAPTPGTGKGLICDVVSLIASGKAAESTTLPHQDDEIRKKITAELLRGSPTILLDNVDFDDKKGRLDSSALASVLTSLTWSDRLLGASKTVSMPNRALWMMTGNNPRLSMELARRAIRCRIDARVDQPWRRTEFKHPDLRAWVLDHRPSLVHATLLLVRHWLALGRPRFKGDVLGSFEQWSRIVGGALEAAGISGFLGNLEEMYDESDAEGGAWREFVERWWERHGGVPQSITTLLKLCREYELLVEVRGDKSERSQETSLGIHLGRQRDRVFGNYRVCLVIDGGHKGKKYGLTPVDSDYDDDHDDIGEPSGEPLEPLADEGARESSAAPVWTSRKVGDVGEPSDDSSAPPASIGEKVPDVPSSPSAPINQRDSLRGPRPSEVGRNDGERSPSATGDNFEDDLSDLDAMLDSLNVPSRA
ncbi:MAG: hypothetical protein IT381_17235 [Deltaproteobacteria bacterium]|nr:hypothetical protein [Deltaproteobacteria bacterium]